MKRMINKITWSLVCLLLMSGIASAEEATLQWARPTTLFSLASGVVAEVKTTSGQKVKKGQLLLQLQQEVFASRLRAAEMQLKQRKGFLQEAKAEYQRSQELYDNSMLSEHELELKRLDALQADSEHSQAQAELATARFLQQQSLVVAPFDAIVTEVHVSAYQAINSAMQSIPMVSLVSSSNVSASAKLSLPRAMSLTPGQQVKVEVNGTTYAGVLTKIELGQGGSGYSSANTDAVIEVDLPLAPGGKVYPGVSANIKLP